MSFVRNPDGSYVATVQCLFTGAQDPFSTGVCTMTMVIDADSATSNAVALAQGLPGLAATFRNIAVTAGPANSNATGSLTLVSPGGPGEASVYDLALTIPKGADGGTGSPGSVLSSSDVTGTPTSGQMLVYNSTTNKAVWTTVQTKPVLYVVSASSFTSLSMTAAGVTGVLTNITIPAQSFAYRPRVEGDVEVTPAAIGTRIDGEIRMGGSATAPATIAASGTMLGYARGQEAAGVAYHLSASPRFGVAILPTDSSPAAVVPAGTAQTIVFSAVRQYGSANWSTSQVLAELRIWLDPA
ncbi:hypothetical protein [Gordonia soli]|uniref:Minor tail protein n=1 Tax=Gordonia soli NBRC 108243 TaxID=1223545 RepID=M0QQP3_9ACTN|nr:hypothetical protein [Gordonia soli]GAC70719.1 hypothetical protein GS4_39_00500 [Gordonia soli NBRC 108243]